MKTVFLSISTLFGLIAFLPSADADIFHIDPDNDPGGDGSSWTLAMQDLREALAVARSGDEIWLKRGVHRTSEGTYRGTADPYPIRFGVTVPLTIRGGFQGTETSLEQRGRVDARDTILDGDTLGDDGLLPLTNPADNAHVVLRVDLRKRGNVLVEGVTIQGAFGAPNTASGGIVVSGRNTATFTLENCLVHRNDRGRTGGAGINISNVQFICRNSTFESNLQIGIATFGSHATIENTAVVRNGSDGISISAQGNRDFSLIGCNVVENQSNGLFVAGCQGTVQGSNFSDNLIHGALFGSPINSGNPTTTVRVENSYFQRNDGIGAICSSETGAFEFVDCEFSGNLRGLQITRCEVLLDDCLISRNAVDGSGGAIYAYNGANISGRNVVISENGQSFAGGIRLWNGGGYPGVTLSLTNPVFRGNEKTALFIDGYDDPDEMHRVTLFNPIFVGNVNRVSDGGAIRNGGQLKIYQGTFVGNEAVGSGDVIAANTASALDPETTIIQSILWRNDASGADPVDIPLTPQSQGNHSRPDPEFLREPDSGDGDWTTFADNDYGDLQPTQNSPVANQGDIVLLPPDLGDIDQDGNTSEFLPLDANLQRRVNGGRPDIGAIESESGDFSTGIRQRSQAPFFPNTWTDDYAGCWSGLVWRDNNQTEPAGSVRKMIVRTDRRPDDRISGKTSVAITVEGKVYRFRGGFDAAGVFSETIELRGTGPRRPTATLELQTGLSSGENYLDGTFTNDTGEYRVFLAQSSFHSRRNPAVDEVGKYTSLLVPGPTWTTADPTGYGAGTVAVRPSGSVRMKGYLADGQRYSWAGKMANSRFIYFWKDLYRGKPKGYLAGRFQVREMELVSDMDGFLEWKKHPGERARYFPEGFQLEADFVASRYDRYRGQRILLGVLDEEPNAALTIEIAGDSEGGLDEEAVEWTSRNVIRSGELGTALRFRGSASSGLFSGFWRSESGEKITIRAVAFQKQGFVFGHVLGNAGSQGSVEMHPEDRPR